jgi:crotonobetainyl-CoA:carnitine CoA-transferase CaiB-like acyl-CoA transferase
MTQQEKDGMLSPYRVLDLTDEKGLFCGKLLGDLGADVIKVEKPGGDPARAIGPFYHDEPDPEKSLFWWAYNTSKRGITLDMTKSEGQDIFKRLVQTADFVVESFHPGYMESLGFGYSALESINPRVIMVSITPFGQTGPYRDYKGPDIVTWALGGHTYQVGEADRPPVRISHHSHSYLHAAAEAAVGAMVALRYRRMTGKGQQVDVSIQEAVLHSTDQQETTGRWDAIHVNRRRGVPWPRPDLKATGLWPCKDGYVVWIYWFGLSANWTRPLIEWMQEEGELDDYLRNFDWEGFDPVNMTQDVLDRIAEPTRRFFLKRTKAELYQRALTKRIQLYPLSTSADILEDPQLAGRGYWVDIEHQDLGSTIRYPGAFVRASETPASVWRRAPRTGEHNQEIYGQDLGISKEELEALKAKAVV